MLLQSACISTKDFTKVPLKTVAAVPHLRPACSRTWFRCWRTALPRVQSSHRYCLCVCVDPASHSLPICSECFCFWFRFTQRGVNLSTAYNCCRFLLWFKKPAISLIAASLLSLLPICPSLFHACVPEVALFPHLFQVVRPRAYTAFLPITVHPT